MIPIYKISKLPNVCIKCFQRNFSIIAILIICILSIGISNKISQDWQIAIQFYRPLSDQIQGINSQLVNSHLWLEEGLRGNQDINFNRDVTEPLDLLVPQYKVFLKSNKEKVSFYFDDKMIEKFISSTKSLEKLSIMFRQRKTAFIQQKHEHEHATDDLFNLQFHHTGQILNELSEVIHKHLDENLQESYVNNRSRLIAFSLICLFFLILVIANRIDLKRSNEKINNEKNKALEILKKLNDAVVLLNQTNKITFVNSQAELMLRHSNQQLIGKPIDDFLKFDKGINFRNFPYLDIINILHFNHRISVQVSITELKGVSGQDSEKVIVINDVSEQQRLTSILIQQSRHIAMGEMIGGIAHQWRQPLNALSLIVQKTQLLFDKNLLDHSKMNKNVAQSMQIITDMSRTIDNFRDFFSPKGEMETFKLKTIITQLKQLLQPKLSNQQIEFHSTGCRKIIMHTYKNELLQIILAIIKNAIEAIEEYQPAQPQISLLIRHEKKMIFIHIRNNGGRLPINLANKIFLPYFSSTKNRAGNGLFMAKTIMEEHIKGTISYVNKSKGCSLVLAIPQLSQTSNKHAEPYHRLAHPVSSSE